MKLLFKPGDMEAICNLKCNGKKLSARSLATIVQETINLVMGESEGEQ